MTNNRYLRPDVAFEPLVNQWYAGPDLVAPGKAAMTIAYCHVELMKSFVQHPELHAQAKAHASLTGEPFIDLPAERAEAVKQLLRSIVRDQAHMLQLARDLKTFDRFLHREATGLSHEPLYARLSPALRGYVELVYDLAGQPSIRLLEALMYRGRYANRAAQSVALTRVDGDARPFVLGTPRLLDDGDAVITAPFASPMYDELARARAAAVDVDQLADRLELAGDRRARFAGLFHDAPAPQRAAFDDGDRMRIRYLGHASVLIETRGSSVLVDPLYAYAHRGTVDVPRFTNLDLPEHIDYVAITQGHHDHLVLEALMPLRHRIGCVIVPRTGAGALEDPSLKLLLQHVGFPAVRDIDDCEVVTDGAIEIAAVPFFGKHCDLNIRGKTGYRIAAGGRAALLVAGSNNLQPETYAHVRAALGGADALFVGLECEGASLSRLYGALLTDPLEHRKDQARRTQGSDAGKALELVGRFAPSQVYAYAMGQEPWLRHLFPRCYAPSDLPLREADALIAACRARGVNAECLFGRAELVL